MLQEWQRSELITKHRPVAGVSEAKAQRLFVRAHALQFGAQLFTLFGELGVLDDVVIHALFIVGTHVGDDRLYIINAHARLDVVAQVVEQQHTLLVVTDLLLVIRNFTLEFVLATGHTHIFQYIAEGGLVYLFHIDTTDLRLIKTGQVTPGTRQTRRGTGKLKMPLLYRVISEIQP
ncbi:hypothetical protein AERO8C_80022 [Aeromonas veronii]|uniref:Uncharacterized protein n=1 Tax=Aeromonas veronii TaxID=654 RepID=A0A653LCV5_AERVE|nr:hypothetical protein AERO8C_80022 [Aeromonas veronii]